MPTALTRPVSRETSKLVRTPKAARPMIVTLTLEGVELRAKGTRTRFLLPYGAAWVRAAQLAAAAQIAERKTARAERKLRRGG